jgi:outer membrane protein OmpA-like peptidoglycan-associated protein
MPQYDGREDFLSAVASLTVAQGSPMLLAALLAVQAAPAPSLSQGQFTCPDGIVVAASADCPGLVFFDSGETEIRREWQTVLDTAAAEVRTGGRLVVTGHSDTPGSRSVNGRLAKARAEAVATALVARGVARSAIETRSAGETQLLIPTADGVREIHNRRVSIVIAR